MSLDEEITKNVWLSIENLCQVLVRLCCRTLIFLYKQIIQNTTISLTRASYQAGFCHMGHVTDVGLQCSSFWLQLCMTVSSTLDSHYLGEQTTGLQTLVCGTLEWKRCSGIALLVFCCRVRGARGSDVYNTQNAVCIFGPLINS